MVGAQGERAAIAIDGTPELSLKKAHIAESGMGRHILRRQLECPQIAQRGAMIVAETAALLAEEPVKFRDRPVKCQRLRGKGRRPIMLAPMARDSRKLIRNRGMMG